MIRKKKEQPSKIELDFLTPISSKLQANKKSFQLAAVTHIDPIYDWAELFLISDNKKVKIPINPSLGLKKDDVVILLSVEGYYHVLDKAHINYIEDEFSIFDPSDGDPETMIKTEDIPEDFPIDYPNKYHIKKVEGDIVKYIKETGYKITSSFLSFFSKTSKLILDNFTMIFASKTQKKYFFKNGSYQIKDEDDNGEIIDVKVFYNNNDTPYLIKAQGKVELISRYITLEYTNIDIPFSDLIELTLVCKPISDSEKQFLRVKNVTSHTYDFENRKNIFNDVSNQLNVNLYNESTKKSVPISISADSLKSCNSDYLSEHSTLDKIVKNNFHVFVKIKDNDYDLEFDSLYVTYLKAVTIEGEVIEFSKKKTDISQEKANISDNFNIFTDNYKCDWQSKHISKNFPYNDQAFEFRFNYSKLLAKNYSDTIEYSYNHSYEFKTQYYLDLEKIRTDKIDNNFFVKGGSFSVDTINTNLVLSSKKYSTKKPVLNISITDQNKHTYIYSNIDLPLYIENKNEDKKRILSLTKDMFYLSNFKNVIFNKTKYIGAEDSFAIFETVQLEKIYVKQTLSVEAKDVFFNVDSYIIKATNFQSVSDNALILGHKSASIYSSPDTSGSSYSAISLTNSAAILTSSSDVFVKDYCKC